MRRALPAVLLALSLAACGGSDEPSIDGPGSLPEPPGATGDEGTGQPDETEPADAEPEADPDRPRTAEDFEREGVPVTASGASEAPLPLRPEPGPEATGTDSIGYGLEANAVEMARFAAPTSTTCVPDIVVGETEEALCTVDFGGLQVPYEVRLSGGTVFPVTQFRTEMGVLARQGVADELIRDFGGFGDQYTDFYCDVPELELVVLDAPTGATCSAFFSTAEDLIVWDVELVSVGPQFTPRF